MPTADLEASGLSRRWAWLGLALVLAGALTLRLWGIKQGLPYAYNSDEAAHFVPRAIGMFVLGGNPHYFANPPAFTYLLHFVFAVWFGGRAGVSHEFAANPTAVWVVARATAAVLGTISVWLLYLVGTRLMGRAVGLLAAALEAVAFLPVFYAHLALNDVPALAPLTLSLLGTAGILRKGRVRDYLLAGIGLGLGAATKYTAGIVILPLLAASAAQYLSLSPQSGALKPGAGRRVVIGLTVGGLAAILAFLVANPYAALDFQSFRAGIVHQSTVSSESEGKLGAPRESGILYYLWSFTWGLGWIPSLAALGGAVMVWFKDRRLGWILVPAPLLFLLFMGTQSRFFGRWLMPILPIACLLGAFFALRLAGALARLFQRLPGISEGPRVTRGLRAGMWTLVVLAMCVQGAIYSIHSGVVLSRPYTSNTVRKWMVAHIPAGSQIVVEPTAPDEWVQDVGHPTTSTKDGDRWLKYASLRSLISANGKLDLSASHVVNIEDYEKTLSPALIPFYQQNGYCWVITGSTQYGRAFADPKAVPEAIAYYRALAHAGEVVYHISPYTPGSKPVTFNFDWTFDYYPLAYKLPGPEMTIYRLHGDRCATKDATGQSGSSGASGGQASGEPATGPKR